MNFIRRPDYTSEITQFIDQLKVDKPPGWFSTTSSPEKNSRCANT